MRFREGVVRFLITDINNAAASAQAQSEVSIMYDLFSQQTGEFNHLPGGSTVQFMDGHVEFIKYKDDIPVDLSMALLIGSAG